MSRGEPKQTYTLLNDGGGREKRWAKEIFGDDKGYERLWSGHIAPLTFRFVESKNHYLRPSGNERLLALADTSYATLFHITEAHAWAHRLKTSLSELKTAARVDEAGSASEQRKKEALLPTEVLYCFFSHGYSLLESSGNFGAAVNEVLAKFASSSTPPQARAPFSFVDLDSNSRSRRLGVWGDERSEKAYHDLSKSLSRYRGTLVHDRPVFILTRRIPQKGHDKEWSGLAAICKAVREPARYQRQTVGVSAALEELISLMRVGMNGVWGAAAIALEPLLTEPAYLRAQREGIEKDRELRLERIKNFITLTRLA
jgi:hypothetical protein